MTQSQPSLLIRLASVLIIVTLTVNALLALRTILVPLAFSLLLAIVLFPLCRRLEGWGLSRILAIVACLLVAIAVVSGLLTFISMQVMSFAEILPQLTERTNELLGSAQVWVERTFHVKQSSQLPMLRESLTQWVRTHGAFFTSTLSATTATLGTISLLPILIFFFLLYRDFLRKFFHRLFKSVPAEEVEGVLRKIQLAVSNYIAGLGLVILIVAVLNITGLLILGIPYAIFFGVLGALLTIIPYVGIFIGALLPIVMSLVYKDSLWYAVGVAGVFFLVQLLEGNFITPNVVGSKVSVNPLAAIVGLILGGMLWGAAGMILALPVIAVLKVVFDSVESLQPFGYLLGDSGEVTNQHKDLAGTVSQQVRKVLAKPGRPRR